MGLPQWLRRQRICLQCRRPGFDPWIGKIPQRREWLPTPLFLPGEFHGQRNLVGFSPQDHKEADTSEWLTDIYKIDNGNLLYSTSAFLEYAWRIPLTNPMATVHGVQRVGRDWSDLACTIWPSNPTPGHISGGNHNRKKYMHLRVNRSTVYYRQDMKATE